MAKLHSSNGAKKIVLTQKWGEMSRAEITSRLNLEGHTVNSKLSGQTDLVLCVDPEGATNKIQQAKTLGVQIMTYAEFFKNKAMISNEDMVRDRPMNEPDILSNWIKSDHYFKNMQQKSVPTDPQTEWQESTIGKIITLEPLMMFFQANFDPPSQRQWAETLEQWVKKSPHLQVPRQYEMEYKCTYFGTLNFKRHDNQLFQVTPFGIDLSFDFSLELLGQIEDVAKQNMWDLIRDEFDIDPDELAEADSLDDLDIKDVLRDYRNFAVEIPDYTLFGDWTYFNLDFWVDAAGYYYTEFTYDDREDEQSLKVFAPITKELVGKILYYVEEMGSKFGIFLLHT